VAAQIINQLNSIVNNANKLVNTVGVPANAQTGQAAIAPAAIQTALGAALATVQAVIVAGTPAS